jgi:Fur family ferric uptake transcriptional regulator
MEHKESATTCFGLRPTKTRRFLETLFRDHPRPYSVPEILAAFSKEGYQPNKTTVYREMEHLVKQGKMRSVPLASEVTFYELVTEEHHHHFVCQSCRRVTKLVFAERFVQKLVAVLEEEGNRVTEHLFEIFGICKQCQKKL